MKSKYLLFLFMCAICAFSHLSAATKFCTQHATQIYAAQDVAAEALFEANRGGGRLFRETYSSQPREVARKQVLYKNTYPELSKVFKEFLDYCAPPGIDVLYQGWQNVAKIFDSVYSECIATHQHEGAYLGRAQLRYDIGDYLTCAEDLAAREMTLSPALQLMLAEAHNHLCSYSKAIQLLKDLDKPEALFQQAIANAELGSNQEALASFAASGRGNPLDVKPKASPEFADGLLQGLVEIIPEASSHFVPSLGYSHRGMSTTLWCGFDAPLNTMDAFVDACLEAVNMSIQTVQFGDLETCVPEYRRLHRDFAKMSERAQGRAVGHLVGKYGLEILNTPESIKGALAFRELQEANAACYLETLSAREELAVEGTKHFARRCHYFESAEIDWPRQKQVVAGKRKGSRATFTHPDAEGLLKKFAGTGLPLPVGLPRSEYLERIDFGEDIGDCILPGSRRKKGTSWGEVYYTKDGAVIVPVKP